jgi:TRAP-type C4-dicarboxylate transport system permease small subunit
MNREAMSVSSIDKFSTLLNKFLTEILSKFTAAILLGTTLFALLEIVRRYIFGWVFEWGQDAVVYTMMSGIALSIAVTQAKRNHLVMSAALQALASRGLHKTVAALDILVSFCIFLFCSSLMVTAWPTIQRSMMMQRKTESLAMYLWPFQVALMIGFGLMGLVALIQTIEGVVAFWKGNISTDSVRITEI